MAQLCEQKCCQVAGKKESTNGLRGDLFIERSVTINALKGKKALTVKNTCTNVYLCVYIYIDR